MIGMIMTLDGDEVSDQSGVKVGPLATIRFKKSGTLTDEDTSSGLLLQLQQISGIGEIVDEGFGADDMFAVPQRR